MRFKVLSLRPENEHLHGATLAQTHLARLQPEFEDSFLGPSLFVLDLSRAVSITASYLRATVYWALLCGQSYAKEGARTESLDPWTVRPLPLFPLIIQGNAEVMGDVDDYFRSRSLPILVAHKLPIGELAGVRLLGSLDPILAHTLQVLAGFSEATAKDLSAKSKEIITVNGWSNRLADLHLLRLVSRRREGKFWYYSPIATSIKPWA